MPGTDRVGGGATVQNETCHCTEMIYLDLEGHPTRVRDTRRHSCEYVRRRNALIPQAQALAYARRAQGDTITLSEAFMQGMDLLAQAAMARGEL